MSDYDERVKFKDTDRQYFEDRKRFSHELGPVELRSVIDYWPFFVGNLDMARSLAIVEISKETLDVPGDIAEFGCWKGSTTLFLAELLKLFDLSGPKVIHVFDSFEGLTEFDPAVSDASGEYSNAYKGSRAMRERSAQLTEVADNIAIPEGKFETVLLALVEENPQVRPSLIYCDTDLYSATKTIGGGF